ncbi:MAG: ISKra4 family transposase [Acidimicrobiales bacterium]
MRYPAGVTTGRHPALDRRVGGRKRGLFEALQEEYATEVGRLATLAAAALTDASGDGLRILEIAVRTAVHQLGAHLLEGLLALDPGHRGPRVSCGKGHEASFVGYRGKRLDTVLGRIELRRAYYHCSECGHGVVPRDEEVGVGGASLSPGLEAMVARVGAAQPFRKASAALAELAGVEVNAKAVERSSETTGRALAASISARAKAMAEGSLVPLSASGPTIEKLYVAMDGTGVPTVLHDTEGRAGKAPDGRARTREVKLACLFTQTELDEEGHPVRDPGSSSYMATFEGVEAFGSLVFAEARRRGSARAGRLTVLGDGAPWIWNLAGQHFPGATQIVDLYHAREHVHDLWALVVTGLGKHAASWLADRLADLDRGDVVALAAASRSVDLPDEKAAEVEKALGYFQTNAARMRYAEFRALGLFVGSGMVEAGCKAVVAQRMKLSGMRWSVRGATGIVSLRCEEASGRWEEIWGPIRTQTTGAA